MAKLLYISALKTASMPPGGLGVGWGGAADLFFAGQAPVWEPRLRLRSPQGCPGPPHFTF